MHEEFYGDLALRVLRLEETALARQKNWQEFLRQDRKLAGRKKSYFRRNGK